MKIELFDNYKKLTADEGFYLTSYNEDEDIKNYSYARMMFCPLNIDVNNIREISEEQHKIYLNNFEKAIEEENA